AVLRRLRDLLDVPRAIVNLFDLEKGEVEWLAAVGRRRVHLGPGVRYSLALAGNLEALKRGEPQIIDVRSLPATLDSQALLASDVRVYMVVPMIAHEELIGSVSFGGPTGEFPPEQVGIAREAATQLAIAIAQARLQERVNHHAKELEDQVRVRTAALEAAQEELVRKERLATLGQLAGSVGHELRNPLGVMTNSLFLLGLLAPDEPPLLKEYLGIIKGQVTLSEKIVGDLLDFARVKQPQTESFNLRTLAMQQLERIGGPSHVTRRYENCENGSGVAAACALADR